MPYVFLMLVTLMTTPAFATPFNPLGSPNPLGLYGEKIEFDVMRKGEVVGEHITEFSLRDDYQLSVKTRMNIDIFALFIPLYAFEYKSMETWQSGQMVALNVDVLDGSDRTQFKAQRKQDVMDVSLFNETYQIHGDILSTNHWNATVVDDQRVLNTLTGNVNKVEIIAKGMEKVDVRGGSVQAYRYDYTGDLKDTSVWYDEKGRWVKLRFLARDGSIIEYFCRTCKTGETS